MSGYSYELPNEADFKSALIACRPHREELVNRLEISFQDSGKFGRAWDSKLLNISFRGTNNDIDELKRKFGKAEFELCLIAGSGFEVGEVRYHPVQNPPPDPRVNVPPEVDRLFRKISVRDAEFDKMAIDERLAELVNFFELLLKKDGKYIPLDYETVFSGAIDSEWITSFRKKLQCFRHGSDEALKERKSFSARQKEALADFGVAVGINIYKYLQENPDAANNAPF